MAEGTPTTDHVRKLYTLAYAWRGYDDVDAGESDLSSIRHNQRAEFDRWLAAHDAEVARQAKARGWDEGKSAAMNAHPSQWSGIANPYEGTS